MNRKINLLILILICISLSLYSTTTTVKESTHPFFIQAAYEDVLEMSFTPLVSQEENFASGMPFNLEDPSIRPRISGEQESQAGLGRQIARWNFISNTLFSMSAKMSPLTSIDSVSPQLWYTLGLNFTLSYYANAGDNQTVDGTFIISPTILTQEGTSSSGDPTDSSVDAYMGIYIPKTTTMKVTDETGQPLKSVSIRNALNNPDDSIKHGFIGAAQGTVILALTPSSIERVTSVPAGSYHGSITIKITTDSAE